MRDCGKYDLVLILLELAQCIYDMPIYARRFPLLFRWAQKPRSPIYSLRLATSSNRFLTVQLLTKNDDRLYHENRLLDLVCSFYPLCPGLRCGFKPGTND